MKFLKILQYAVPWLLVFGNAFSAGDKCEEFGCNDIQSRDFSDRQIPTEFQTWQESYDLLRLKNLYLQHTLNNLQTRLKHLNKSINGNNKQSENEVKPQTFSLSNNICGEILTSQRGFINYHQYEMHNNSTLDSSLLSCVWMIRGDHEYIKISTHIAGFMKTGKNFAQVLEPGQTPLEMKSTNLIEYRSQLFKGPVVFVLLFLKANEDNDFRFQLEYEALGNYIRDTCLTHQILEYTTDYHFNSENVTSHKSQCAEEVITLTSKFQRKTFLPIKTSPEQCNSTQLILFSKQLNGPGNKVGNDCCKTNCNSIFAFRHSPLLMVIRKRPEAKFEFTATMIQEQIQPSSYVYDDNMTLPCGGLLNGIEGIINYKSSLQYANNERCIWAIVSEPYQSKSVVIKLDKYGLQTNNHDKLYVMEITANNGSMLHSPKITNLIGEGSAYTAYGSHVYIVFYSDISIQGKGFELRYSVNEDYFPAITYPLTQFNFFHQQTGFVIVNNSQPSAFQIVALTPAINDSQTDSVLQLNVPIESFCNKSSSAYLYTTVDGMFQKDEINWSTIGTSVKERMALIVFPNDYGNEFGEPMEIRWETKILDNINKSFVKTDGKCGGVVEGESGIVQYKPNRAYNNNEQCSWAIISNSNGNLNFKLVKNGLVSGDTLELLKVDNDTDLLTTHGSLSRSNLTLEVQSSVAILVFTSDENETGQGFIVEFETVPTTKETNLVTYTSTHTSNQTGQFSFSFVPHSYDEFFPTVHIFTYQTKSTDNTKRAFEFQYGIFRKRDEINNSCQYEFMTVYEFTKSKVLNKVTQLPELKDNEECQEVVAVSKINPWWELKSEILFVVYKMYHPNPMASFSWNERESEVVSTVCGGAMEGDFGHISYKELTTYDRLERCNWIIKSRKPNGSIKFKLETSGLQRCCDYIRIYSEDGTHEASLGDANDRTNIVTLQGSAFNVSFTSGWGFRGHGFRLTFKSI